MMRGEKVLTSIDTHFQDGAGSVSLSVWPIMAANALIILATTRLLLKYLTYKTKHWWHSVDAEYQETAAMSKLGSLPIKAVSTFVIYHNNQVFVLLSDLEDQ